MSQVTPVSPSFYFFLCSDSTLYSGHVQMACTLDYLERDCSWGEGVFKRFLYREALLWGPNPFPFINVYHF